MKIYFLFFFLMSSFYSCLTPKKEKQFKTDIFNLQTRILKLEQSLQQKDHDIKSTDETAKKKIASAQTDMEKVRRDIQVMQGDIDSLKVGVTTGQLPGSEDNEMSVANSLKTITERLEALEETQDIILAAIEKNAKATGGNNASTKKKGGTKTFSEIKESFDKKRFKHVSEEGPTILKSVKGKEKQELNFMIAESLFKVGNLRDAALKFNDYVQEFSSAENVPHAKLRMGDAFRHLGDKATAKLYYEDLIQKHESSDEAKKAKERLQKLN